MFIAFEVLVDNAPAETRLPRYCRRLHLGLHAYKHSAPNARGNATGPLGSF